MLSGRSFCGQPSSFPSVSTSSIYNDPPLTHQLTHFTQPSRDFGLGEARRRVHFSASCESHSQSGRRRLLTPYFLSLQFKTLLAPLQLAEPRLRARRSKKTSAFLGFLRKPCPKRPKAIIKHPAHRHFS